MNVALIGPSGAGKGTHALRIMKEFQLAHISTGDVLRKNLEERTALGLLARKYMNRGELVPDEVVSAMVEAWLETIPVADGVLFDGFPRTLHQAKFLDEVFRNQGRQLDAVVYLKVSDNVAATRLMGRLVCSRCNIPYHQKFRPPAKPNVCDVCGGELYQRDDDKPEVVLARLRTSHRSTGPLLEYYQTEQRLLIVNGEGHIDAVNKAVLNTLRMVEKKTFRPATAEEARELRLAGPMVLQADEVVHPGLDVVLLGGPGSGKGTQAEQLSRKFGIPHISTGDLFRENLKHNTPLGKMAKSYMDRGELVPDNVTESMVQERLTRDDTQNGFILDGFPRTLAQAHALDEIMTILGRRIVGAIFIKVCDAEIIERLSGRRICSCCQTPYHLKFKPPLKPGVCDVCGGELYQRDDDNPQTIRARLKTFHVQNQPLVECYQARGLLSEVDGEGKPATVTGSVIAAGKKLIPEGVHLCSKPPS